MVEWTTIFEKISVGDNPEWFPTCPQIHSDTVNSLSFQQLSILSPTAGTGNLFDYQPTLSFDSTDSSIIERMGAQADLWCTQVTPPPPELPSHVNQISGNLKKIKMAWSKPFRNIEARYKLVVADLHTMHDNVKSMHAHLGEPLSHTDMDQTVWEA